MADLLVKKEAPSIILGQGRSLLFYSSLLIFFLILASYGGLAILNPSQQKTKEKSIEEIKLKQENLRPELLNEIFLLDERLKNMRMLLSRHTFVSNVFRLIESDSHPLVHFINFSLITDSRKLEVTGETANYTTLSKQIGILERDPQIEKVEFGGLSFTAANLLGFKLTIILKPGVLQFRP